MNTRDELNKKVWYRALKVLYFFSFFIALLIFVFGIPTLLVFNAEQIPTEQSLSDLGHVAQATYPNSDYANYSALEVGKRIYEKRYSSANDFYFKNLQIIQYQYKDSLSTRIVTVLPTVIVFLMIVITLAWFLERTFFYIFIGERYFKLF